MDLFYCKIEGGNFGDDMNTWFWDEVFPEFRTIKNDYTMFGIGSILGAAFLKDYDKVVVAGSGSGYGPLPVEDGKKIFYGWVRGPLTARNVGIPPERAITDPACLTPRIRFFEDVPQKTGRHLFIPHCGTERLPLDWQSICARAGLDCLSPASDSRDVIRQIAGADIVVTESMHGAIIADAFRVPWIPVAISPTFNSFKWEDWALSMEMSITPSTALMPLKTLYYAFKKVQSSLRSSRPSTPAQSQKTTQIRLPKSTRQRTTQEYRLSDKDKRYARMLSRTCAPAIEWALARDLARIARRDPYLSQQTVLERQQARVLERLDQLRVELPTLP